MSGVLDSGIGRTQDSFRPTSLQLGGRKRRAGDQLVLGPGAGVLGSREVALRGTPRKRVLFGSDGPNSISSGSDVPEDRSGWPPDDEYPVTTQFRKLPKDDSPRIKLENAVLQLQKDLDEVRAESRYCKAGRPTTPAQTSARSCFTSTPVPRYAGRYSWDQYRHVFEAIVCSNGWDEVTAALQLLAHLEGDALNVALLVPEAQQVLPGVLGLSGHYDCPGRSAEYRRQFERASRSPGDDPSVFAIELETLARRSFVDVDGAVTACAR